VGLCSPDLVVGQVTKYSDSVGELKRVIWSELIPISFDKSLLIELIDVSELRLEVFTITID